MSVKVSWRHLFPTTEYDTMNGLILFGIGRDRDIGEPTSKLV